MMILINTSSFVVLMLVMGVLNSLTVFYSKIMKYIGNYLNI